MGKNDHHVAVAKRVLELLKAQRFTGFQPSDVMLIDFPFANPPTFGVIVSPIDETEGTGMNDADDIRYAVQVMRVFGSNESSEGFDSRANWRSRLRQLFHRRRLGVQLTGACELMSTVRFGTIKLKREWDRLGMEASVLYIHCLIREPRD